EQNTVVWCLACLHSGQLTAQTQMQKELKSTAEVIGPFAAELVALDGGLQALQRRPLARTGCQGQRTRQPDHRSDPALLEIDIAFFAADAVEKAEGRRKGVGCLRHIGQEDAVSVRIGQLSFQRLQRQVAVNPAKV